MKISTRGRYSTRVLIELADCLDAGPVLLKDIAAKQHIPLQYLEQLMPPLVAAGLINSTRGVKGGIWLARLPKDIRLSQVIAVAEGSIAPADCIAHPDTCQRSELCATRDVWAELEQKIYEFLDGTTIQDLLEKQRQKESKRQIK